MRRSPPRALKPHLPVYKVLCIGDSFVGKTSVMNRFVDEKFQLNDSYLSTIGVDFRERTIRIDENEIKLQIWDTAGQERFRSITQNAYRGVDGVMCVFSVSDEKSFTHMPSWIDDFQQTRAVPVVMAANKCDLRNREVTVDQGKKMAAHYKIRYFEVSAKNGDNINEAFIALATEIKACKQRQENVATERRRHSTGQSQQTEDDSKNRNRSSSSTTTTSKQTIVLTADDEKQRKTEVSKCRC
eukprot:TRINITY_DN7477_c0_g1_i1.p1 TRINITY_DN7477_c0_g1~~TRINITY_DN7477_c0_g1_i1.p1  ORF type:complete len:242 (-),score=35.96 TRINITY_DN7477_c0_g1_i1:303-1028(-)